jgi:DNA topoisomerase-1
LIIVESPTKARTISKFLGKDFHVKSSFGHIRDLPQREMGVDIENNFAPKYVVNRKANEKVKPLKEEMKKAESVILATDEDREGEAIAWHLAEILKLDPQKKNRIVFHEITKKAIEDALENPRSIDFHLVDAQQARRVLDRLVGYELSPLLWKKIKRGLSAGRVQSIALRIICEREREIEKFEKQEFWTISADLETKFPSGKFNAALTEQNGKKVEETVVLKLFTGEYKTKKTIFADEKTASEIKAELEKATYKVSEIAKKETQRTPPPPFTTSTLQQAAISSLGFSAKQTMMVAQKLYEQGHITYMRTDSVNLSLPSMITAKKTIEKMFGKDFALESPRFFKTRARGAQEAHEAIRPTRPEVSPEELNGSLDANQHKLYRLIWRRMVASQMQPAVFDSVKAVIAADAGKNSYTFQANGSTIKFPGYLKVYGEKIPVSENLLPPLKESENLKLDRINAEQKQTSPPPRYSEATIVKVLEEHGIGRPSTYAPTISTIIDRKYVDKNEERRLFPLEIGFLVNDLLVEHFKQIVDIRFTATLEEDFDKIAEGKKEWVPVIREFYGPFHKNLETKSQEIKKENILEKLDKKCPECGGDLLVRFGRFGKFIACNNFPNCRYTEKTEEDKKIEQENSGETCDKCGAPMVLKRGKYGAFLGCSKYPDCKNIKKITSDKTTGVKCPKCPPTGDRPQGDILERRSRKGRLFYGCSNYPHCDFSLWNRPTGKTCEKCGSLMVYQIKGKEKCSNKECK